MDQGREGERVIRGDGTMKLYIWCSDCAEFHEAKQIENPLGGDAHVWTDKCGHIVVIAEETKKE